MKNIGLTQCFVRRGAKRMTRGLKIKLQQFPSVFFKLKLRSLKSFGAVFKQPPILSVKARRCRLPFARVKAFGGAQRHSVGATCGGAVVTKTPKHRALPAKGDEILYTAQTRQGKHIKPIKGDGLGFVPQRRFRSFRNGAVVFAAAVCCCVFAAACTKRDATAFADSRAAPVQHRAAGDVAINDASFLRDASTVKSGIGVAADTYNQVKAERDATKNAIQPQKNALRDTTDTENFTAKGANLTGSVASTKNKTAKEDLQTAARAAHADESLTFWSDYPHEVLAAEITARMSNEELLSQLFMFGWAGAEPSKLVTYWVAERNIGSIKIFGWNTDDIERVAKNIATLQQKSLAGRFKIPLFVATDQEGGWIRHVKGVTSDTPGNLAIGAGGYPQDAYYSGYYIAKELKAIGINMNFAPAVDLYTDHNSSVIGPRSFGENPEFGAILGSAFAAGSFDAGVIPTAKHFPGHGDTGLDSHGKLPVIPIDRETLFSRELLPFIYLIEQKIPAIMSGHLAFPNITVDEEPASLSKTFLRDILRGELGYQGLIISDDMMMNGATAYAGGLSQAVTMAIEAGNNILCSSTTPQIAAPLWERNIALMKNDESFKAIVQDSAYRVIKAKLDYFRDNAESVPIIPDVDAVLSAVPDKEGESFFLQQACRSITLYKRGAFPYPNEEETVGKVLIASCFAEFFDEGKKRYADADTYYFKYSPTDEEIAQAARNLMRISKSYDTIIISVMNGATARIARALKESGTRVVVVSGLAPVPVMSDFEWADSVVMCYSYSPFSFRAVFAALAGDFEPHGVLPLTGGESNP